MSSGLLARHRVKVEQRSAIDTADKADLEVGDEVLKVVQLQQRRLAFRNHCQRRLQKVTTCHIATARVSLDDHLDATGFSTVSMYQRCESCLLGCGCRKCTGRHAGSLAAGARRPGVAPHLHPQSMIPDKKGTWSRISEWPSARMMSMMRAEKEEGKGHANSVRYHWLAYSTGATVFACTTFKKRVRGWGPE